MSATLKTFYKYCLKYKISFFTTIILMILYSVSSNLVNVLLKFLVDGLGIHETSYLFVILVFIALSGFLAIIFQNLAYWVGDIYLFKASKDIRVGVFSHLHKLDFSYHANKRSGSLISAIKRGDGAVFSIDHHLNRNILRMSIDFIFIVSTFFLIDFRFALVIFTVVFANLLLAKSLITKNIKSRKKFNKEEDKISHIIVDNLINYDTVKYFAKENWERDRLESQYTNWMSALWGYANTFRYIDISTGILALIGSTSTIALALWTANEGLITMGELVLIIAFVIKFFPQMTNIVYQFRDIAKSFIDIEKYFDILKQEVEVKEIQHPKDLKNVTGQIEFKNVNFRYHERDDLLNDFNLTINRGESIAFVGESGVGKTTITKLLLRFYDLTSGQILIEGIDIKECTKSSLRKNIGIVPQEPILFNDTIRYNISYADESASLNELQNAAEIANLDQFIDSLPHKFDTLVGERGIKLSGGQKQRLAIARMFLADPPIVIFDEATSQLDSHSEKQIQEAFWKLAENRTTIIIAHRLSTVMRADRIIVLNKGKIAQQGNHTKLIMKEGIYKSLWGLQKGVDL